MSYRDFTLAQVKKEFQLTIIEKAGLFNDISTLSPSHYLNETLNYTVSLALASNTEKARSELIITPILLELRKQLIDFNFFSGVKFNVNKQKGLNGFCDFIITHSQERLFITSPVIMLVEAKNEHINSGLGQCIAEMIAAQLFNQQENNLIETIYGAVTTGTNWQFLKLTNNIVEIDLYEYYLRDIDKILGFFKYSMKNNNVTV